MNSPLLGSNATLTITMPIEGFRLVVKKPAKPIGAWIDAVEQPEKAPSFKPVECAFQYSDLQVQIASKGVTKIDGVDMDLAQKGDRLHRRGGITSEFKGLTTTSMFRRSHPYSDIHGTCWRRDGSFALTEGLIDAHDVVKITRNGVQISPQLPKTHSPLQMPEPIWSIRIGANPRDYRWWCSTTSRGAGWTTKWAEADWFTLDELPEQLRFLQKFNSDIHLTKCTGQTAEDDTLTIKQFMRKFRLDSYQLTDRDVGRVISRWIPPVQKQDVGGTLYRVSDGTWKFVGKEPHDVRHHRD